MKSNTLWLALALSGLFNVFFLAGYIQARSQARRGVELTGTTVARELRLDDNQNALYQRLRTSFERDRVAVDDALAVVRAELVQAIEEAEPDLERISVLAESISELLDRRQTAGIERFQTFIGSLNADQCRQLSRRMRGARRHEQMRRRLLEKFDENGNGSLDPLEREKVRGFMEERFRDGQRRRQERIKRFDADGDGVLSDEERAAMDRWRRETFGDRPVRPAP